MSSGVDAYPLAWPPGWPRTRSQSARFDTSFAQSRDALMNELRLMGARGIVLSTNVELRRDGLPYAGKRQPDDPAVAVYFEREGKQQCIPCDKWNRVEDNLQAIRKTIEALRGLERWGAKSMVDAAFQGFKALPESVTVMGDKAWWEVLGVQSSATKDQVVEAYKTLRKKLHPDVGGSDYQWNQLQQAYKQSGANG